MLFALPVVSISLSLLVTARDAQCEVGPNELSREVPDCFKVRNISKASSLFERVQGRKAVFNRSERLNVVA